MRVNQKTVANCAHMKKDLCAKPIGVRVNERPLIVRARRKIRARVKEKKTLIALAWKGRSGCERRAKSNALTLREPMKRLITA